MVKLEPIQLTEPSSEILTPHPGASIAPLAWCVVLTITLATSIAMRVDAAQPEALAARQVLGNSGIETAFVACIETAVAPEQPAKQRFGTVFVLESVVWYYSPETGTTILGQSPPPGKDFLDGLRPLLARIAPPGATIKIYQRSVAVGADELAQRRLAGSCVIGCVAALARLLIEEGTPDEAGFVLFLFGPSQSFDSHAMSPLDHSVLVYRKARRWVCIDPRDPALKFDIGSVTIGNDIDPLLAALAERVDRPLQRATYFPIAPATLNRLADRIADRAMPRSSPRN